MLLAANDGVIRLDRFGERDLEALVAGDGDAELRRRFEVPASFEPSLEHSRRVLARWVEEWARGERYTFTVRPGVGDDLLGGCELRAGDRWQASYWTYPAHRGKGVASRALVLLLGVAFGELDASVVEARIDEDNTASIRVAERAGFQSITSSSMSKRCLMSIKRPMSAENRSGRLV